MWWRFGAECAVPCTFVEFDMGTEAMMMSFADAMYRYVPFNAGIKSFYVGSISDISKNVWSRIPVSQ
jgi:hypothetical protein